MASFPVFSCDTMAEGEDMEEHHRHICYKKTDTSQIAEHGFNKEHHMQFQNTEILSTKFQPIGHMAGNTNLNPNNMNKKYGFVFCRSQEPLIHSLKEQWEPLHGGTQLEHYGPAQSYVCP
jgi:hypothetical protein